MEHTLETRLNDLGPVHNAKGDMVLLTLTSALRARPFPEVDLVVPESVVWTSLGIGKVRILPEVLKVVEYGASNAISFSGWQENCRGRAHAIAISERNFQFFPRSLRTRIWIFVTYVRCCILGEIDPFEQMSLWYERSQWCFGYYPGCSAECSPFWILSEAMCDAHIGNLLRQKK